MDIEPELFRIINFKKLIGGDHGYPRNYFISH